MRSANMHRWPQIARKQLETEVPLSIVGEVGMRNDFSKYLGWTQAQAQEVEHLSTMSAAFLLILQQILSHNTNTNTVSMKWPSAYVYANLITKTNSGRWGPAADWAQKSSIPASSLTLHIKSKQQVQERSRVNVSGWVHLCECVTVYTFVCTQYWPLSLKILFRSMCESQRHAFYAYSWSLGVMGSVCFDRSVHPPT